jgi:acetate kinase
MLARPGGVGEHTPTIQAKPAHGHSFLGLHTDDARNQTTADDCDLTCHDRRSALA